MTKPRKKDTRFTELKELIELERKAKARKAELIEELGLRDELGTRKHGDITVQVTRNTRFSPRKAAALLEEGKITKTMFNKLCKTEPNAVLAKELLTEELFAECVDVHANKVAFK